MDGLDFPAPALLLSPFLWHLFQGCVTKGTLPLQLLRLPSPVLSVAVAGCSSAPLQLLSLELSVLFCRLKLNALLGTSKGVSGETL